MGCALEKTSLALLCLEGGPESRKPLRQMPAPDSQTVLYQVPSVDLQHASFPAWVPHGSQSAQGNLPDLDTQFCYLDDTSLKTVSSQHTKHFLFSLFPHPFLPLLALALCSTFPWLSELVSCHSLLSKPRNTQCGALDKHGVEVTQQPKVSK